MKALSIGTLRKRLTRATWPSLLIMAGVLLGSMAISFYKQNRIQLEGTKDTLSALISSYEVLFAQEILLNQEQGVSDRVRSLVKDWDKRHPKSEVCLEIQITYGKFIGKTERACSETRTGIWEADAASDQNIDNGQHHLAKVHFVITQRLALWDMFPPTVLLGAVLAMLAAILSFRMMILRVEDGVLNPLLEKLASEERNKAIARTSQMLAHDIKKPFNVLQLVIDKLRKSENKEVKEIGEVALVEVNSCFESLDSMLNDILDVDKNMIPTLKRISLQKVVDQALNTVMHLYPKAEVTVTCDLEEAHRIYADKSQILRVLTNLFENAFQAMDGKGELMISSREKGKKHSRNIEITVSNSGPTIPVEDRSRIFEPLVTKKRNGTGLGLAISKKIIEAHGGQIWCKSSNQNTTFGFFIPISDKRLARPGKTLEMVEVGAPVANKTSRTLGMLTEKVVLVFDDEAIVHNHWKSYADSHPYLTMMHFRSWEEFVAQAEPPLLNNAVAFVDLEFEGSQFDGLHIAKCLRQVGISRVYAITSDGERARQSGLFEDVFGKTVPKSISLLIA